MNTPMSCYYEEFYFCVNHGSVVTVNRYALHIVLRVIHGLNLLRSACDFRLK
jgi:hypothetical protein